MKYVYGTISCQVVSHVPAGLRNRALEILSRKGSSLQDFIRGQLHHLVEAYSDIEPSRSHEPQREQPKHEPEPQPKAEENIRLSVIEAAYEIVLEDLKSRRMH
ncbi:MAG: hypothetical protein IKW49_01695 [Opitutales bacterium]|nr:hypothetical protein [Opitutales bacterium]